MATYRINWQRLRIVRIATWKDTPNLTTDAQRSNNSHSDVKSLVILTIQLSTSCGPGYTKHLTCLTSLSPYNKTGRHMMLTSTPQIRRLKLRTSDSDWHVIRWCSHSEPWEKSRFKPTHVPTKLWLSAVLLNKKLHRYCRSHLVGRTRVCTFTLSSSNPRPYKGIK